MSTNVISPNDDIPSDVVAVISATVATALKRRVRITRVRRLRMPTESTPLWAFQGRVTIMSSHQTKR